MYDRRVIRGNTYAAQILPAAPPIPAAPGSLKRRKVLARLPSPTLRAQRVSEWSCREAGQLAVFFQSRPVSRLRYTQLGVLARPLTR
jgi:hypothetical protein